MINPYECTAEEKIAAIKEVAVVDDKPENLAAAKVALAECLPNAVIRTFATAGEIVAELMFLNYRPTLVLTDLDIEEVDAGFKVNLSAWGNGVPAVVVTAKHHGGHHGTTTSISMLNGRFGNSLKDNPETWRKVINFILAERNAIHLAILGHGKREKFDAKLAETFDVFSRMFLRV